MIVNRPLNKSIGALRRKGFTKTRPRERAVSWKEEDSLGGEVIPTGVIILPTKGCRHGRASGCSMCGYVYESGALSDKELLKTLEHELGKLSDVKYLKIFTSGSFFDEQEIGEGQYKGIVDLLNRLELNQLQVESRPEFLRREGLGLFMEGLDARLEVGIGLETSNDLLRDHSINKGFSYKDYEEASRLCNDLDVLVKTYLLLKPPFIPEREAVDDAIRSARDAATAGSHKISVNPMNIQKGTFVELLWKRGDYRPPWLWSLVEVLKKSSLNGLDVPILSHPSGGGSKRGAHNCGRCDKEVLKGIREFSLTQDVRSLEDLECGCIRHWDDYLELE